MTRAKETARLAAAATLALAAPWIVLRTVTRDGPEPAAVFTDLALVVALVLAVFVILRTGPEDSDAAAGTPSDPAARGPRQHGAGGARRSDTLEQMGEFTGAVAHDFNNLLTAIITPVQLLLTDLPADDPLRPQLEEVENAASRGASLSQQLLAFGRRQVVKPRPHDLGEIVRGLDPLIRRLAGPGLDVWIRPDDDVRCAMVDPTQMEQLLVNLVVNARDAMPDGGRLAISTSRADPVRDPIRSEGAASPVGYVVLEVSDTGHGFDESVRARLFEPYFTTKEHGTGLGLATVFGIARQSGGFVRVKSTPGVGSSFRVYLPAAAEAAEPAPEPRVARDGPAIGGSELVLVVEDQEPVRQVLVRALTRFGYRVVQASTGQEAMGHAAELGRHIDLMIADVKLPDEDGLELATRLRRDHPSLRVLFTSGFADQELFDRWENSGAWVFLPKPFSVDDLLTTVRRILDGDAELDRTGSG